MENENRSENGLQYFISAKQQFLVVSFLGNMNKQCLQTLEDCVREVLEKKAKYIVVTFHDVPHVDRPAIPALVKAQKNLRDGGMDLRICHVNPEVRRLLSEAGAIRMGELVGDLQEALYSLAQSHKMAA